MPMEIVTQLPYDHPYRWDGSFFGGPKLWRPYNLGSTLGLWLDAEDSSTITLNGSTVSQWSDKSGNDRHATQSTAANQPTYVAAAFSTKPALLFDGTNDVLLHSGFQARTIYAVARTSTTINNKSIAGAQKTSGIPGAFEGAYYLQGGVPARTARFQFQTDTANVGSNGGVFTSGQQFVIGGVITDAGVLTVYLDGTAGTPASGSNWAGVGQAYLGAAWYNVYIADYWPGEIAEVIICDTGLSTDDRQKLEGYLAWKWLMQSALPVGHPYKNLPPTA